MGQDVNELKAVTWAVLGPVPAALIVGFGTQLWALAWVIQLAGGVGYVLGARWRAMRRMRAADLGSPASPRS